MKTETLYSRADWKFHKNRLGYDDVIDAKGRLVATVSVMDAAISEMLRPSYLDAGCPREVFMLEADRCWSIYLSRRWLTPSAVEKAVGRLGKLLGRTFVFEPYHLPAQLEARYGREAKAMRSSMKDTVPLSAVLAKFKGPVKEQKRRLPSKKRLAAIGTHKLKA
jgi:hypothetical protein